MKNKAPLLFILLFPTAWYFLLGTGKAHVEQLPIIGGVDTVYHADGSVDTIYYHQVKPFAFTNQYGQEINSDSVAGKIYIVNYIFTTCRGICPAMSKNMYTLQEKLDKWDDVIILSHTVDPATDSVPVLLEYANLHGAREHKWHFLTGDKKELYDMARHSYFLTAMEKDSSLGDIIIPKKIIDGDGGDDDFIHSEQFVLIDRLGRVRSQKDGTDLNQVLEMVDDVKAVIYHDDFVPRKES